MSMVLYRRECDRRCARPWLLALLLPRVQHPVAIQILLSSVKSEPRFLLRQIHRTSRMLLICMPKYAPAVWVGQSCEVKESEFAERMQCSIGWGSVRYLEIIPLEYIMNEAYYLYQSKRTNSSDVTADFQKAASEEVEWWNDSLKSWDSYSGRLIEKWVERRQGVLNYFLSDRVSYGIWLVYFECVAKSEDIGFHSLHLLRREEG